MKQYRAQWRYRSSLSMFDQGDVVLLEQEMAELINRDSPGVLVPVVPDKPEPKVEGRALTGPPQHRAILEADQSRASIPEEDVDKEVEATEAAVKLAEEMGLDLSAIDGTGTGGRVTKGDVEKAGKE